MAFELQASWWRTLKFIGSTGGTWTTLDSVAMNCHTADGARAPPLTTDPMLATQSFNRRPKPQQRRRQLQTAGHWTSTRACTSLEHLWSARSIKAWTSASSLSSKTTTGGALSPQSMSSKHSPNLAPRLW